MKRSVLVIGHADADGHLITEQVRRNLARIPNFRVKTVVDPDRTKDHKAWTKLEALTEIENAEIVLFVDLMFASSSFAEEADALVDFLYRHREKQFFLMDHHPLPLRRLEKAKNLRTVYRPDVFDCAIGPRSGMMIVAALLEGQAAKVADIKRPIHRILEVAMRRAAAPGGPLPGEKLLALLRFDCWKGLVDLGEESSEFHRLPRGRRPADQPQSKALRSLERVASDLVKGGGKVAKGHGSKNERRTPMPYDLDIAQERFSYESGSRARVQNKAAQSRDLETIVTLLEVAAISLTTGPDSTFSKTQLIRVAQEMSGGEIDLVEEDIDIVLKKQSFLMRAGAELRLR